jgi:hypothetical protein
MQLTELLFFRKHIKVPWLIVDRRRCHATGLQNQFQFIFFHRPGVIAPAGVPVFCQFKKL